MAPILNAKLALFEAKKVARGLIEKDLAITPILRLTLTLTLTLTGGARPHREGPDHVGVQAAYILLTTH